jgi:hypothetical protein
MDFAPIMGPAKYGISPAAPASNQPTALASTVTPSAQGAAAAKLASPENPFTAFAVLAALTFGLMAFSTSVRVGKTTASLAVGTT